MTIETHRGDLLFFDIETKRLPGIERFYEPKDPPKNYSKEETIQKWQDEQKEEWFNRCALDPDLSYIRGIGMHLSNGNEKFMCTPYHEEETEEHIEEILEAEKELLITFWKAFKYTNGRCVGYNVLNFDLPFLLRRSFALSIPVVEIGQLPSLRRYSVFPVCDLFAILYNWGPGKSMKWIAKRYDIPLPCPDVDGSMVHGMNNEELEKYCMSDITATINLYMRMVGIYF